ncbi:serine/threonine-protein kinase [Streptomyces sp. NPDC048606]|uniref:serine/threonine-protein kinase n=1 Tax=Streptomyces sp. NPDC048606 TaxID=3154726 RepID=UPI00342DD354
MGPLIAPLPAGAPDRLGGHRIVGVLGAGGMGTVYLALRGGRPVALKTIRPELLRDPLLRERFVREADAASVVRGPFVAAVLGSSTADGVPWLATEFVPGPTLGAAVLRHGPLPVPAVSALAGALARALTALGRAGVVHRDLKPSNVILGADRPRVVDFGIARVVGDTTLTTTGQRPGTPGYMSPEQVVKGPLGPESDVFCLGAIVVFALTGRHAFFDGDPVHADFRIAHEAPDLTDVPGTLLPVVRACLEKRPADRPTAAEVARALDPRGGALRPAARWLPPEVLAEATGLARAAAGLGAAPRGPARRRVLAAAGSGLLLAATGTALLVRRDGERRGRSAAPRWSGPPGTVPPPLWSYDGAAARPGFGPLDVDGWACFADGGGEVALHDPVSGRRRGRGPVVSALLGAGRPVALAPDGAVLFLDAGDGSVARRTSVGARALPAADGERVYVLDEAGRVVALRRTDGGVGWRVPAPLPGAVLDGATGRGLLVLASAEGGVVALSASDGSLVWRLPAGSGGGSGSGSGSGGGSQGGSGRVVFGERGVLIGGGPTLTCLRAGDGGRLWELPADEGTGFGAPAPAGDGVYVVDGRQLRKVDARTGAPVWTVSAAEELDREQAPLVSGAGVFAASRAPDLGVLALHTGRVAEQYVFAPALPPEVPADAPWRGAVVGGGCVIWRRGGAVRALPGM